MKMEKIFIYHYSGFEISEISRTLRDIYNLETIDAGVLDLPSVAFDSTRRQCYAPKLLDFLIRKELAIWIIKEDIYAKGMNFIFGMASCGRGAVISTYRLDDQLIKKEVIHEVGHVLGLEHCLNECVMRFSNSVMEARQKPMKLCNECEEKLKKRM